MKPAVLSLSLVMLSMTLGACSSGSGGGEGNNTSVPADVTISPDNYQAVFQSTYGSVKSLTGFYSTFDSRESSGGSARARMQPRETHTMPIDCPDGGSGTTTITEQTAGLTSKGDTVSSSYQQCHLDLISDEELYQMVFDGSYTMEILGASGTTDLSTRIDYDNFKLNFTNPQGQFEYIVNGNLSFSVEDQDPITQIEISSTGLDYDITADGEGFQFSYSQLSIYTLEDKGAGQEDRLNLDFQLQGEIDGAVSTFTFTTVEEWKERFDDNYPYSGVIKISSAGGGNMTVTANGDNTASVQVDENNDGIFELTEPAVLWSELNINFGE